MPRYVILEHDHPHLHWDLMLEIGDVLWTWRLAATPRDGERIAATRIGEHRKLYLDYEGPVSGGRGSVQRWDYGTFRELARAADHLRIELQGQKCRGVAELSSHARGEEGEPEWMFLYLAN